MSEDISITGTLFDLWHKFDKILTIILLVIFSGIIFSFVGFSKEICEFTSGYVLFEDGDSDLCEITFTGKVTEYPLRPNGYGMDDVVGVSVDGKQVAIFTLSEGSKDFAFDDRNEAVSYMKRNREVFFSELDASYLYPEREGRCVVIAFAQSDEHALELLDQVGIPEEASSRFAWLPDD